MSQPVLDLKQLFLGALAGEGEVTGLTGRPLRRFSVQFFGEWSIGHDALHLDEKILYTDGRALDRHWAIQFDADGALLGYDSHQAARIRGRVVGAKARLVFDRPLGLSAEIAAPRVVLDLFKTEDGLVRFDGRFAFCGLVIQRMAATLSRG